MKDSFSAKTLSYGVAGRRSPRFLRWLRSDKPQVNVILFFATVGTTFATGWLQHGRWQAGAWYSFGIISILFAHEMGHYLMCRKYGVQATLPYFIPFPPLINPFGTMGAVIKMESALPSRKALFDVAVAGPLAGLALTIPAIYFGLVMSRPDIVDKAHAATEGVVYLGESLLYSFLSDLALGKLPESKDVMLHPLAYAGWAGLFVTALNLLPIGQLDGGHVVYALFGEKHSLVAIIAAVGLGLVTIFVFPGWAPFLILLIWFGLRHPPTLDDTPLDGTRKLIGILTLLIFALAFTPEPFKF